jgi:hypothetical protein
MVPPSLGVSGNDNGAMGRAIKERGRTRMLTVWLKVAGERLRSAGT